MSENGKEICDWRVGNQYWKFDNDENSRLLEEFFLFVFWLKTEFCIFWNLFWKIVLLMVI